MKKERPQVFAHLDDLSLIARCDPNRIHQNEVVGQYSH